MKKLSTCVLVFWGLLLGGCEQPEVPAPPAELLSKEQMVSLLIALHVLEAQVDAARLPPDSARALYNQQQQDLLWKRTIPDSLFYRSYRYYAIHDKDLDDIYGQVVDSLSLRESFSGKEPQHP